MKNQLTLRIDGDKKLEMSIPNPSDLVKEHAIQQAFALFGLPTAPPPVEPIRHVEPETPQPAPFAPPVSEQPEPPKEEKVRVHNEVENTGAATMEEVAALVPDNAPDYVKTGIKMKQGKPAYRCRHICPKCKARGTHYIWQGTESVDCYHCQTTMHPVKAIRGTTLQPDKSGNFYVAGDLQPVLDVTLANQKDKIKLLKQHNLLDKDYEGNY